eukprot:TRINITY_DN2720_c0_g1_i2.p1 TRINITY_DN2720_c0_g1~~TRINITY_DN2720_c0_g1_i2.p1  ORF type:complete len:219 (+),score=29.76 TRINITY_DN2720_c0_g1_i2:419-1075(+)
MIVKRNPTTRRLEKYYHLIGWGTPCVFVMASSGTFSYGATSASGTCYITNTNLVFGGVFLPGFILTSANAVLFFFVASEIHGTLSKAPDSEQREKTKEFRVLMSIFVTVGLSWIFGFLNAILSEVYIVNYIVAVLMTFITPLQGFFIFVAYCANKKVLNKWQGLFAKCFPCCKVDPSTSSKTGTTGTASSTRGGYSSSAASAGSRSMTQNSMNSRSMN